MEYLIIGLIIIILGGIVYLLSQLRNISAQPQQQEQQNKMFLDLLDHLRKEMHDSSHKDRVELQQQLDKINDNLKKGIVENSNTLQTQFKQTYEIVKDVTSKLTKLDETNKQVVGFAEQMKSLENILRNPKQRGILGEYFLETLLANILPPNSYKIQYAFKNGEIVDAVIFLKEKVIPIDSKFSLEKYNQIMEESDAVQREKLEKEFKNDVKKRIDETSKYIRPQEDTTDFAFMFIPAEGIYYNLLIYKQGTIELNAKNLIEYAFEKRVIIVSPTSFYAYLQTVLQGLKNLEMEKNVQEVIKRVDELGKHLNGYQTYLQKLGNNLGTTVNMYNSAAKEFAKIDKDVLKITDGNSNVAADLPVLEKPQFE